MKGTYVELEPDEPNAPPVPPPVRFAPLGPMGLESSAKLQVEAVQIHFPATGSQNGVEQFPGNLKRAAWPSGTC